MLAATSGRTLSGQQMDRLTQTIELGVFLNRCFDGKAAFCGKTYRELRRGLPSEPVRNYLRALRQAERSRPRNRDWPSVRDYRRSVLDISLRILFQLTDQPKRGVLLPLVSLIQLVDDILDRGIDQALSLPTLLSAGSPSAEQQARELWLELKRHRDPADAPLVAVGFLVYFLARLVARLCAC